MRCVFDRIFQSGKLYVPVAQVEIEPGLVRSKSGRAATAARLVPIQRHRYRWYSIGRPVAGRRT